MSKGIKIDLKMFIIVGAAAFILLMAVGVVNWKWGESPSLNTNPFASPTPTVNNGVPSSGGVFSGPLAISFQFFNHGSLDDVYTTANATIKVFHADRTTLFGATSTGASVSGQVLPADNGQLFLQLTPVATCYVDAATTA
ncbi:MAG: hypothetical protein WC325_13360, partial [Candidatus Bathyarchaeia archaeon]